MFSIIVQRGDGLSQGDDIVDPLITCLPVALARGRNEMDEQASGFQDVELTFFFRAGLRLGMVVEVHESLFGEVWYGKLVSLAHRFDGAATITTARVRKPTGFTA